MKNTVLTCNEHSDFVGPVLRLAPGKLDIQLLQASQDAWAGHNPKHLPWDKEPALAASERWWLKVDNVVSMKRAKDALKMRRIMGKPFARKFLQDQEDIFKEGTIKFLDRVETLRKAHDCKVDIYAEFGNYAFDVLTEIVYGGYFKKAAIRPGVSFIQLIGQASAGLVHMFREDSANGRFSEETFLLSPGY
jgi:cytochrome P450